MGLSESEEVEIVKHLGHKGSDWAGKGAGPKGRRCGSTYELQVPESIRRTDVR